MPVGFFRLNYLVFIYFNFYVSVQNRPVKVIVAVSKYGNKYLKTEADGEEPNNLLSLPECP